MIEIIEDGVRKVTLGEGTTYISQCIPKGTAESSGILFSNKPPLPEESFSFQGDEVIIEIYNVQGALSYMKALVGLLGTWKIEGTEEQLKDLRETLDILTKK